MEREPTEQMIVCDELSHLTEMLKVRHVPFKGRQVKKNELTVYRVINKAWYGVVTDLSCACVQFLSA